MSLKEYAGFLYEFALKPNVVGAVSPSWPSLSRKMVEWIDWSEVRAVIEYGPGTGSITGHILSQLRPGTTFFAIEINPKFVEAFSKRYPDLRVYQESVKDVKQICEKEGIEQVDAIVSGLPWASFSHTDQVDFLDAMMTVLRPEGYFSTIAYLHGLCLPAGMRFKRRMREYFSQIGASKTAWKNVPPAFSYHCRR